MLLRLIVAVCIFSFSFLFGQTFSFSERNFDIRNPETTRNIKGNIAVIGNTVLCPKSGTTCIESAYNYSNSEVNLRYVNIDGATASMYPTSSSARLSIPNSATIVWAGVYAQGYLQSKTTQSAAQASMNGAINVKTIHGFYSLLPDIVNFRRNSSYGHSYGVYYPIPNIIGLKGSQINGDIIVSNIRAEEGTDISGLGNSGAWALVVVYEDDSETLKNISVFDGFKEVSALNANVNINISGFLTPSSGTVNSSLSFFVGEGDKYITGDNLYVNGVRVNSTTLNNVMDSSIVGVPVRNPNIINNQGIDIQSHDISNRVNNGDTNATITLTSTQDTYFPIMVAFTTELYEPRVCYMREFLNEHGNASISDLKNGDIVTVRTWFTNLPQGVDTEEAKKVQITLSHDSSTTQYILESTQIKNIGETSYTSYTDATSDDIATFNSTSVESYWNLGTGATSTDGGFFAVNTGGIDSLKAYVDYKAKVIVPSSGSGSIVIGGQYKISYEDSISGKRFGDGSPLSMGSCQALNNNLTYSNPSGLFNIVNENFNGATNSELGTDLENTLYTQIAGKAFNVKLISLDNDKKTLLNTKANITVELIETPNTYNDETCKNATLLHTIGVFELKDENSKTVTINYSDVKKSASFRIKSIDENGVVSKVSCSRDSNGFAIRPAKFKAENIPIKLIGGKNENITIEALNTANGTTTAYNQIIANILTNDISLNKLNRPDCLKDYQIGEFNKAGDNFINGQSNTVIKYDNVGHLSVVFLDSDWTHADNNDGACINNNNSNEHNNGKVGCNVETEVDFMFYPQTFDVVADLKNFNNGDFTYLSESNNMYAPINVNIRAVLHDNATTATNYHDKCWANDVRYSVGIDDNISHWVYKNQNATQRVIFYEINQNKANLTSSNTLSPVSIETPSNNFNNGEAEDLIVGLNFKRDVSVVQNPFTVDGKNNVKLSNIEDDDGTHAVAASDITGLAKFYYGRVYSPNYVGSSPITATMRYEGYCGVGCDMNIYNALNSANENVNTPRWYLNLSHTNMQSGHITLLNQVNGNSITINPNTSNNIQNGQENNILLTHPNPPYVDYIEIQTQSWLVYNKDDNLADRNLFKVEFLGPGGGWAGVGEVDNADSVGTVIQTNPSNQNLRKMDW